MSEKVDQRNQNRIVQIEHVASWLGRPKSDSEVASVENFRIALGSSTNLRAENQDRVVVSLDFCHQYALSALPSLLLQMASVE